ncbi:hypothetical protein HUJ05_009020 [Dendroctonus ponderosae]|nr:hypothetical protein HUJ05_009020 [Dendroctonus ponderosae]
MFLSLCPKCLKTFRQKSHLNRHSHAQKCTDLRPKSTFKCPVCSKFYKNKNSLAFHQKYVCNRPPSVKCSFCDFTTKRNSILKAKVILVSLKNQQQTKQIPHFSLTTLFSGLGPNQLVSCAKTALFRKRANSHTYLPCHCVECKDLKNVSRRTSVDIKPNLMVLQEDNFRCKHKNCGFSTDKREVLIMHILNHDDAC